MATSMPDHFLAHSGGGAVHTSGDGANRVAGGNTSRNLLTLNQTENPGRTSSWRWSDASGALKYAVSSTVTPAQYT